MLVVELNDLRILSNPNVDGFLVGVEFLSSECYKHYPLDIVEKLIKDIHDLNKLVFIDTTQIFHDQDLLIVKEMLKRLNDADYFLYNDLGLTSLIEKEKRFYYSSTYITNSFDFEIVQEENQYVLVSPELSFIELQKYKTYDKAFIIGFGTWEIFHSRRNLITNYMLYRNMEKQEIRMLKENKFEIIEEFRSENYPIIENMGTKIYLNRYYHLTYELALLPKNIILKGFDLEYLKFNKVVNVYKKMLEEANYEETLNILESLEIPLHKGLLYQTSVLLKGVTDNE